MFLVSFTNYAYTKAFKSEDAALSYMWNVGAMADLIRPDGQVIAHFSPITGLHRQA